MVTRQIEVQLIGADETIIIHIGYIHMTAVSNKAMVQNTSTATVLRKRNIDDWNSIHTQCPTRHSRIKKGLEKNVFMRLNRMGTKINYQHILIIKKSFSLFHIVLLLNGVVIYVTYLRYVYYSHLTSKATYWSASRTIGQYISGKHIDAYSILFSYSPNPPTPENTRPGWP